MRKIRVYPGVCSQSLEYSAIIVFVFVFVCVLVHILYLHIFSIIKIAQIQNHDSYHYDDDTYQLSK